RFGLHIDARQGKTANGVDAALAMHGWQEGLDIEPVPGRPFSPDPLGGSDGIQERSVHVEQEAGIALVIDRVSGGAQSGDPWSGKAGWKTGIDGFGRCGKWLRGLRAGARELSLRGTAEEVALGQRSLHPDQFAGRIQR